MDSNTLDVKPGIVAPLMVNFLGANSKILSFNSRLPSNLTEPLNTIPTFILPVKLILSLLMFTFTSWISLPAWVLKNFPKSSLVTVPSILEFPILTTSISWLAKK